MSNVRQKYAEYCKSKGIVFNEINTVSPYNNSTLFCPAGMQKFKAQFNNTEYIGTEANIQACLRMNDFEEIGDGSHLLYFNMIGLFSFRELSIEQAIDFWVGFLKLIDINTYYVAIHPDKILEWKKYYDKHGIVVRESEDCKWSDGEIGGYCTEFFIGNIEIGNIVNPMGNCIDVGFGLERLENIKKTKIETLKDTILVLIDSGYKPSNLKQGYVLRKLLRELNNSNETLNHPFFKQEITRQEKIVKKYLRLKEKHTDKTKEWWFDTHGIDINNL